MASRSGSPASVVVHSVEELTHVVRDNFNACRIIAIDGVPGAGKSTAAAELAAALSRTHLDLDAFVILDQGRYIPSLRVAALQAAIKNSASDLVLSGVCMRAALELVGVHPTVHVYMKRMTSTGWIDGEEMYGDLLDQIAQALNQKPEEFELTFEVRAYHREFTPDSKAAIVIERQEF